MARSEGRASQPNRGGTRFRLVAVLVVAVALGGWLAWPAPRGSNSGSASSAVTSAARRESRPTLDPALFVGRARLAHRVAREIPDVLDRLYCYCGCDRSAGHKSLLSCYTDNHAAT
jgi:hypothetical protein